MSRRLMLRNESGTTPILPPEYQQVEWIKNLNNAYFGLPTILYPDGIDIVISTTTAGDNGRGFFGYYTSTDAFELQRYNNGIWLYYGKSPMLTHNFGSVIQDPTNITILNRSLYIDGVYISTAGTVPTNPGNRMFGVFALYNSRGQYSPVSGATIYRLTLYQGDNCICNLVPCYRKADGSIGMYDTISRSFETNAGSGSFAKGADVS